MSLLFQGNWDWTNNLLVPNQICFHYTIPIWTQSELNWYLLLAKQIFSLLNYVLYRMCALGIEPRTFRLKAEYSTYWVIHTLKNNLKVIGIEPIFLKPKSNVLPKLNYTWKTKDKNRTYIIGAWTLLTNHCTLKKAHNRNWTYILRTTILHNFHLYYMRLKWER